MTATAVQTFGDLGDVFSTRSRAAFDVSVFGFAVDDDDVMGFVEHGVEEFGDDCAKAIEFFGRCADIGDILFRDGRCHATERFVGKESLEGKTPNAQKVRRLV